MTNLSDHSDDIKTSASDPIEDLRKLTIRPVKCNSYQSNSSSSSNSDENECSGNRKMSFAHITLTSTKLRQTHGSQRVTSPLLKNLKYGGSNLESRQSRQMKAATDRIVKQHLDGALMKVDRGNKPWMTQEILDLIQARNDIFVEMSKHERDSPEGLRWYAEYKVIRNNVNTLTRKAKAVYSEFLRPSIEVEINKHLRNMIKHNFNVNGRPALYPSYKKPPTRDSAAGSFGYRPRQPVANKSSHVNRPKGMDSFRTVPQHADGFRRRSIHRKLSSDSVFDESADNDKNFISG